MEPKYLIRKTPTSNEYLDDFDGKKHGWTTNRKAAWQLNFTRAGARLYLVQKTTPTAVIVAR